MVAGLLREPRAALERLDHEVVRDVAREPEMDGRVDQRLHHQEHVGGAGAGHRGRHRDPLLVLDLELGAQRAEQRLRLVALVRGRRRASRTRRSCRCRCGPACWASRARPGRGRAWRRARWSSGPASTDSTSWPCRSCGPISRPTRASIWGLTARMMTSAPATASTFEATARIPWARRERRRGARPRVAGHDLDAARRGCRAAGPRSWPRPSRRSRRSRSCDSRGGTSRRRIAPGSPAGSGLPLGRAASSASAGLGRHEPEEAAGRRPLEPAEAGPPERAPRRRPGRARSTGSPPAGRPAGRDELDRGQPAAGPEAGAERRRGHVEAGAPDPAERGTRRDARRRRARRAAPDGPRVGDVEVGPQAVRDEPVARAVERGAVRVRGVQLALVREQGREEPDARRRLVDPAGQRPSPSSQRVTTSSSAVPGRVVDGAALERAAAQEPVVGERRGRRRRQRRGPTGELCGARAGVVPPPVGRRGSAVAARRRGVGRRGDRRRRARASSAARSRPRRNGFVPALPRQVGAQLRPALEVVRRRAWSRACRTTGSRRSVAERHGGRRRRAVSRCAPSVSGGDMPSNAAGSMSSARTSMPSMTRGPGREKSAGAVDREHAALSTARSVVPALGPRRPRPLGDRPRQRRTRRASGRGSRGRPRGRASQVVSTAPAALLRPAAPSRRRAGPARGPSGRPRTAGRATRSPRPGAGRSRGRGGRRRSPRRPCSRSRRPSTTSTAASSASVIAPTVWIELRIPSIEAGSRLSTVTSPSRRRATSLTSLVADRAHAAQLLGEDQVGLGRRERRVVELVQRRWSCIDCSTSALISREVALTGPGPPADDRDVARVGRVVAVVR